MAKEPDKLAIKSSEPRPRLERDKPQLDVFLRDVKMYTFAAGYGVNDLMDLALKKLGAALISLELSDNNVADLIQLVGYCHRTGEVTPELQSFVDLYLASRFETLWHNPAFSDFVIKNRKLTKALFDWLSQTPERRDGAGSTKQDHKLNIKNAPATAPALIPEDDDDITFVSSKPRTKKRPRAQTVTVSDSETAASQDGKKGDAEGRSARRKRVARSGRNSGAEPGGKKAGVNKTLASREK
jgi:hypothetical protein